MKTFDTVTVREIEALATWLRANSSDRGAAWLRQAGVVGRAQKGSVPALKSVAELINEQKGPWAPGTRKAKEPAEGTPTPKTPKNARKRRASAALPPDKRTGTGPVRTGLGSEWDTEIGRRLDLMDSGQMTYHRSEDVFAELAEKYPSVKRALSRQAR